MTKLWENVGEESVENDEIMGECWGGDSKILYFTLVIVGKEAYVDKDALPGVRRDGM